MEYNKVFKIAAFDLDGTLLDSADDLIYSLNLLLKEKNQSPMKKSNIYRLVGNGALAMIREAYKLNSNNEKDIDWKKLQERFLEIYKTQFLNKSTLYPHTKDTLKSLRENNIKMIVVSNKPSYFVNKILEHYKISKYFDAVSGGDTFGYRKPDPKHLFSTIEQTGIKKYSCCFIGDSINDALCAKKANVRLILLKHGYSLHNLDKFNADYVLSNLKNLASKICKLLYE